MNRISKTFFFITWFAIGTMATAYIIGNNPDTFTFLNPSKSTVDFLLSIFNPENSESLADVELLYIFTISFFMVLAATLVFYLGFLVLTRCSSGRKKRAA